MTTALDLETYLARIGYAGTLCPDLTTLEALHLSHVSAIPFENLDIQMGLPIRLDLESLQRKLVARRRGGYCFEQNTLFLEVLRAAGFEVAASEARVRQGAPGIRPRTHMVLIAAVEDRPYLCDVGFGGDGLLYPIAMDASEAVQGRDRLRVAEEGSLRVLQGRRDDRWEDLYAFMPEPSHPIDFEVGNWFTSTHPRSVFVTNVIAQRATPDARHILHNLTYTVRRGSVLETREFDRDRLVPLLHDVFGIDLPADARFRALDGQPVSGPPSSLPLSGNGER